MHIDSKSDLNADLCKHVPLLFHYKVVKSPAILTVLVAFLFTVIINLMILCSVSFIKRDCGKVKKPHLKFYYCTLHQCHGAWFSGDYYIGVFTLVINGQGQELSAQTTLLIIMFSFISTFFLRLDGSSGPRPRPTKSFRDRTQRRPSFGRTLLDEWSAHRRTRNPSKRAATDPHHRPRGHWARHCDYYPRKICMEINVKEIYENVIR